MTSFKIVSLNIKVSNNPPALRSFLQEYKRDQGPNSTLFCLQELDVNMARSGALDVLPYVAEDDDHIFAPTISFSSLYKDLTQLKAGEPTIGCYGLGTIAHGARIVSHKIVRLGPDEKAFWDASRPPESYCWEREPRIGLFVEIDMAGRSLWVVNTHLAHTSDRTLHSDFRLDQIQILIKAIHDLVPAEAPIAILGDYNATPDNVDLSAFHDHFTIAPIVEPTKITKAGLYQVDHCFYRGLTLAQQPRVIQTAFSDHKAIECAFTFDR